MSVEPLDECVSKLEWQLITLEMDVTNTQVRVHNELMYVDKNLDKIKQTLTSLTSHMIIVEETKKLEPHAKRMKLLNEEMAMVCKS